MKKIRIVSRGEVDDVKVYDASTGRQLSLCGVRSITMHIKARERARAIIEFLNPEVRIDAEIDEQQHKTLIEYTNNEEQQEMDRDAELS